MLLLWFFKVNYSKRCNLSEQKIIWIDVHHHLKSSIIWKHHKHTILILGLYLLDQTEDIELIINEGAGWLRGMECYSSFPCPRGLWFKPASC